VIVLILKKIFKKRWVLLCLGDVFLIINSCFGYSLLETDNFILSSAFYLRNDLVTFKNVVDLDNRNKDDSVTYFGIDYNLSYCLEFKKNGPKFYLKLERNGPYDYDAPLFIHNTLMTQGGVIEKYHGTQLLPQIEEFWLDMPLADFFRSKIGLYTYEVGNGFSLNGGFENFGFTLYKEWENSVFRIYYCRPDLVYKNPLGPRIRQEKEQEIQYDSGASNFFSADAKFNLGKHCLHPYIGALIDYTSEGKRNNSFSAPIKRDILGTAGLAYKIDQDNFSWTLEMAHNFGQAKSSDSDYEDILHTGYLIFTDLTYPLGKFVPSFQFLLCSGNKVTKEMVQNRDEKLTSSKNRAFSYYSPLNTNLSDSISSSNVDARPIVAMGTGYGLNYGILRPTIFSASDFDNLVMYCLGFDLELTEKLSLGFYGYLLRSFAKGAGMYNDQAKYLSKDLGKEADLFIDYRLNKNILISFLGGCFFPGRYHKEKRSDIEGSLFSPFLRGDGDADPAYQLELAVEFNF